ncbi:MAG: C1 family peptidase [Thermoplasmata archaeon]|nr:C1 family peptidase [Thermoplasmata archaeon]
MERRIEEVRQQIASRRLRWNAGETSVSHLSPELRARRLGLLYRGPTADELSAAQPAVAPVGAVPPAIDWRAFRGVNWVTSVKDQGACGSCVAFGTLGATESQLAIDAGSGGALVDLSEAFLFFCGGGTCEEGWEIPLALEFLQNPGVPDAACLPYHGTGADQPCTDRCADWASRCHRITSSSVLASLGPALAWVATTGPVVAAMDVYEDFFHYTGGVYEPTSLVLEGSHAVAVVGYDQVQKAWLCKNSWGTGWGEAGFFWIAFDSCNMLSRYPMYGLKTRS